MPNRDNNCLSSQPLSHSLQPLTHSSQPQLRPSSHWLDNQNFHSQIQASELRYRRHIRYLFCTEQRQLYHCTINVCDMHGVDTMRTREKHSMTRQEMIRYYTSFVRAGANRPEICWQVGCETTSRPAPSTYCHHLLSVSLPIP